MAAFAGLALLAAGVIAGLAYFPTVSLVGAVALPSMLLGCGISWLASCAGAVPVALAVAGRSGNAGQAGNATNAVLGGTAVRFLTALVLAAPLAFASGIDRRVLIACLAASYLLMLPLDTYFAVWTLKRYQGDGA